MTSVLTEIVIESTDPAAAARFWSAALGWDVHEHQPGNVPWISASGDPEQHDLKLVFVPTRDGRPATTRLYLNPRGHEQAEEIERLRELGATSPMRAGVPVTNENPWVALVDPGGTGLTILPTRID
jgi:catechol 2,3-dioxygenase-like lactoylglutathione lyase family enzyme